MTKKKEKNMPIETQLFDFKEMDPYEDAAFNFYETKLKIDIGPFKKGHEFPIIAIDYHESLIHFFEEKDIDDIIDGSDGPIYSARLHLSVGEEKKQ